MIYEHPLAYVLGLEGVALLRAFTGHHDRAFVEARLAEIRGLLDDDRLASDGVEVARVDTVEGYRIWSATYDGPNATFALDEPVVAAILDELPTGVALDAGCGTGRVAAALAARGHRVIGVDSSPDMLDRARARVPGGDFRLGDLRRLPLPDGAADLVVCSLALTHVPALGPVLAEFARVLRPGGHVVVSDVHPEGVARGVVPPVRRADGAPARVATYRHPIGDYVRAALAAGLRVRRCEEPPLPDPGPAAEADPGPPAGAGAGREPGPWDTWPWSLAGLVPEAARAALAGTPAVVVWHLQRET
ncbi:methyltransferase domain-containing protein [Actinomadura sp. ATCC 31491]|uniref:Methyltransferase domain-containing protein n=1 Tax=Actinomadura luzonensis TaxID=2805427 RepID=A0ABT0G456_9ACTN|nr:methyltransferase domain-containing protein [Actinomadura luzonensis]MCK2219387.1 methyltransferase domain-containing protein [Actinomadura luzonensis]